MPTTTLSCRLTIEAKEGIRLPHWPLRPGRLKDKHKENGQNGMPAMPCAWLDVLGSVQEAGDGDGTNLPGTAVEEGGLPRVRGGGCSGISADAPSESILRGAGGPGRGTIPPITREAQTYRVSLPKRLLRLWCLVEGCLGGASNRINLRVHFAHHHVRDTIVILEEGNRPYPK